MAARIEAAAPARIRLPADDGIAIWFAKPGDVLPDGTIATPVDTPFADAQPFEYTSGAVSGDVEELAGGEGAPGNNQAQNKQFRAVVTTLGLDQDQAQELHQEISKQASGITRSWREQKTCLEMVVIDTKGEISGRLSELVGLDVSAVSHAADMLTLHFGPQRQYTTRRGTVLEGGAWALHIQCMWRIERGGDLVATQDDLCGPDEKAHLLAQRLDELFVKHGPTVVESASGDDEGGAVISLCRELRIFIIPDGGADDEDWRFFEPGSDAKHFVIEGGKVDPYSLS
jgi:hypothetical protein